MLGSKLLLSVVVAWFLGISVGMYSLGLYENKGASVQIPEPIQQHIKQNGFTLDVYAHPKCPCTPATINELERLLSRTSADVQTTIHFFVPKNAPKEWCNTRLFRKASQLQIARIMVDTNGRDAQRVHAELSGHCILRNSAGEVLFAGGITAGRGHEGYNNGAHSLLQRLHGVSTNVTYPVFGCELYTTCKTAKEQ